MDGLVRGLAAALREGGSPDTATTSLPRQFDGTVRSCSDVLHRLPTGRFASTCRARLWNETRQAFVGESRQWEQVTIALDRRVTTLTDEPQPARRNMS